MTQLSVNVNKVATLRNSRGGDMPNVVRVARDCEIFGADGISIHPRPDERHIRLSDVYDLRQTLQKELNIEGYPSPEFVGLIQHTKPHQVTLMPDSPTQLTTNMGWDTEAHFDLLSDVLDSFRQAAVRTVVFVMPDKGMIQAAAKAGADRVELFAGPYVDEFEKNPEEAVRPYVEAAECAHSLGLGVNAGHDFSLDNLSYFVQHMPWLDEVSVGHALISDALYIGLEAAIKAYKAALEK